jgi:Rieske Fe-S protein
VLIWLGLAAGGGAAGALLVALGRGDRRAAGAPPVAPPDGLTRIALSGLAPGARRRIVHDGRGVELWRRADGSVVARSLVCTHRGCEVRWSEAERVYRCPCHDGLFAEDGRVVLGPPPRPLPVLPVEVAGGVLLVGP